MSKELPYIRVGNYYYKIVNVPLASGDYIETIIQWNVEFIKQDHGKDAISSIPKYDGFCLIPSHLDYQQVIGKFYNRYLPFEHKPRKGKWNTIDYFLRHIFGDQYELGLDYFKLLLEKPTQKLPVLCLVSKERGTGKTTFLLFLKAIFGGNMTINSNEDFKSAFNSSWISKLIIGVDETFLDRKEDSERIKNLSTARLYKSEAKGKDRFEVEFFGKFVLCSNNEFNFLIIDPGETRYWVLKIKPFEKENNGFLELLKSEIPCFLFDLINRPFFSRQTSRMWFDPKLLKTEALRNVIKYGRNKLEIEIIGILQMIMDVVGVEEVRFCLHDVCQWLHANNFRSIESSQITRILQNEWKLTHTSNSLSYTRYVLDNNRTITQIQAKGRYYTVSSGLLKRIDSFDE